MSLRLGDIAPNFQAKTTAGDIDFYEYLGDGWGVLFSHPADYTPVCTTELGKTALLQQEFAKRNVKVLAVSVDPLLPYFIESVKIRNADEAFVKIEGVNTKEAAHMLVQKQVWLPEDDFHKYAGKSAPISLLGFHIIHDNNDLGEILEVIEQPHQLLCRISLDGKEALIPVHQETLQKIDKKTKRVMVDLPDGLLDIFR